MEDTYVNLLEVEDILEYIIVKDSQNRSRVQNILTDVQEIIEHLEDNLEGKV